MADEGVELFKAAVAKLLDSFRMYPDSILPDRILVEGINLMQAEVGRVHIIEDQDNA